MYVYDPKRFGEYKDRYVYLLFELLLIMWFGSCFTHVQYYRWIKAIESSIEHLNAEPKPNVTFLNDYSNGVLSQHSGHLNCFNGGNFILGGQVLDRQDFIDYGLKLVEGCRATYAATTTGIGPESFGWDPKRVPDGQEDFFEKNGFWIDNPSYDLRPEVIESYYYAWRATGDTKVSQTTYTLLTSLIGD